MTPEAKVFLYMVTMDDAAQTCAQSLWQERYHLVPRRMLNKLRLHGYLLDVATGFELTEKGRTALADIADWLWVHQYYLPGVIDFAAAKKMSARRDLRGYPLVQALLEAAKAQALDDNDYMALLLRQQLKLEFGTHHDHAALQTLMRLMYRELDVSDDTVLGDFSYHNAWMKITEFEKQLLTQLLGRLDQTVADFEMAFAQWLQDVPSQSRFFTNFEVMTIVMYELGHDQAHLDEVYQTAAKRRLAQTAAQTVAHDSPQRIG